MNEKAKCKNCTFEMIKEMAKEIARILFEDCLLNIGGRCADCEWNGKETKEYDCQSLLVAKKLLEKYQPKIPEGSVVLTREEFEKIKSLYDCGSGYMTSSIGDLPLTVEGLRKAVDEITRLNRVEAELQELNAKYYNEAKDLRRENQQLKKQVAELEDKLENGTLIELPCKVGDIVYEICKDCLNCAYVKEVPYTYDCWCILEDETNKNMFSVDDDKDCIYKIDEIKFEFNNILQFNKTVFLTKAEAEKKLKELKGEV